MDIIYIDSARFPTSLEGVFNIISVTLQTHTKFISYVPLTLVATLSQLNCNDLSRHPLYSFSVQATHLHLVDLCISYIYRQKVRTRACHVARNLILFTTQCSHMCVSCDSVHLMLKCVHPTSRISQSSLPLLSYLLVVYSVGVQTTWRGLHLVATLLQFTVHLLSTRKIVRKVSRPYLVYM